MLENGGSPEQSDNDDDIKVTDRRHFTSDGALRDELPDEDEKEAGSELSGAATTPRAADAESAPEADDPGFQHRPLEEPEGVDFTMLINAMAQPALIFLGEIAHPGTGKSEINLEQARLQIDLLDLLRVKCRGNLTPDEDGLLDRVLYQLRMLYVAQSGQPEK